jgi:hypothetical protein
MPYALVVAGVSVICGDVLCRFADWPAWAGLLLGAAALLLILLLVGRRATESPPSGGAGTPPRATC